jgi:2,3-bisphosphoglycerate-independent phosphoglycerate mutase
LPAYEGRTPLEVAHTPAMDRVAALGVCGLFAPIPEGMPPGSDVGNLSCFGYDPRRSFSGRAPIEAARQGIVLAPDEVCFRCNLVNIHDATMRDFTAGHIPTDTAGGLIAALNDTLGKRYPVTFHTGVSYRHLAVVKASSDALLQDLVRLQCEPPHNITDKAVAPYLPRGGAQEFIRQIMDDSQAVLAGHPNNAMRMAAGELPATQIWLWGQGQKPSLEPYAEKFGLSGAVISAVDLVNGIGVLAGLEVISVPGATGWIDTNYAGKCAAGLDALQRHDFVYIHLEAPDETAHQGRADLKIQAIEDMDRHIVAPFLAYQERYPDLRILVAPDHFTTIETKTHAAGPVPFALCGPGVPASGMAAYSEKAAAASGILVPDGYRLIEDMIRAPQIALPRAAA